MTNKNNELEKEQKNSTSLKNFEELSDREQEKLIEKICWELRITDWDLRRSENNDLLRLVFERFGIIGDLIYPALLMSEKETTRKNRERLNKLSSVAKFCFSREVKRLIDENYDELFEWEQKEGNDYRNNAILDYVSFRLAIKIRDELKKKLEWEVNLPS